MNSESSDKKKKPRPGIMLRTGIVIGLAIGAGLGVALDNVAIGLAIGLMVGVAIGSALDKKRKRPDDKELSSE